MRKETERKTGKEVRMGKAMIGLWIPSLNAFQEGRGGDDSTSMLRHGTVLNLADMPRVSWSSIHSLKARLTKAMLILKDET
jgi:hypothetical protein